jgi:hypothetical protein
MVADPIDVALIVTDVFRQLGIPYLIAGSLASSFHGEIRATLDVDMVAEMRECDADRLLAAVSDRFYANRDAILSAIRHHRGFNLIHLETLIKVDVYVPAPSAAHLSEMKRGREEEIADNPTRSARVASAEDVVLFKLDWFRQGGGVSERQWRDVLGVLKVQGSRLDLAYLRSMAGPMGLSELLEQVLAESELTGS